MIKLPQFTRDITKLEKVLEEKPKIVLPESDVVSRYVQLYVLNLPWLRCGLGMNAHSTYTILEKTLKELGVNLNAWRVNPSKYYRVVGSGNCLLRKIENQHQEDYQFLLSMNMEDSQDYPLGADWHHLYKLRVDLVFQKVMDVRLVNIDDFGRIRENVL